MWLYLFSDVLGFTKRVGDAGAPIFWSQANNGPYNRGVSAADCGKQCLLYVTCIAYNYAEDTICVDRNIMCAMLLAMNGKVGTSANYWLYTKRKSFLLVR